MNFLIDLLLLKLLNLFDSIFFSKRSTERNFDRGNEFDRYFYYDEFLNDKDKDDLPF